MCDTGRKRPVQPVALVQKPPLTLDCNLYPHLERDAEESLEFDNLQIVGSTGPVVVPADDAVTEGWVVAMQLEVARPKFKLNSDSLLAVTDLTICDAVGVRGADRFDAELKFLGDVCEEVDYSHLAVRRVLERSIFQW